MTRIAALLSQKIKIALPVRRPTVYDQISPNLLPLVNQRYV